MPPPTEAIREHRSTESYPADTISLLGAHRDRELAGRSELAGDDERLPRRRPRQGRARDHLVTVKDDCAFTPRDSGIMREIAPVAALSA